MEYFARGEDPSVLAVSWFGNMRVWTVWMMVCVARYDPCYFLVVSVMMGLLSLFGMILPFK